MARVRVVVLAIALFGCGDDDDPLDREEDVAGWANASSALGVYTVAHESIAFADGQAVFQDPACPMTTDDGTTVTIRGSCTDIRGFVLTGVATVVRSGNTKTLTLEGFGDDRFGGAVATTGVVTVVDVAADRRTFEVATKQVGGVTTDVTYSGTVQGSYTGPTTWNGSGSISRDGDFFHGGTVDATTVDQVRDNAICAGQGISGTTTMTSDAHVVVISYDGATDCDDKEAAKWSRDGEDQGLVEGITCSGGRGGVDSAWIVAIALLARRRRNLARCQNGSGLRAL